MGTYLVWVGLIVSAMFVGIGVGVLLAGPSRWAPRWDNGEGEKEEGES